MSKKELCKKVRELCEESGEEFLFTVDGASSWYVKYNNHIRDVAYYHRDTEDDYDA